MIIPHDSSDFECKFRSLRWLGFLEDFLSYMTQRTMCDIHYKEIGIHLLGASCSLMKFTCPIEKKQLKFPQSAKINNESSLTTYVQQPSQGSFHNECYVHRS